MGGSDAGSEGGKRKKHDLGRNEWNRQTIDRRTRTAEQQEAKRRKLEQGEEPFTPIYATQFSQEEIASEQRRPKKKVAVLLGYSGTGYHGMQLSPTEKTIEGELFPAFVAAGAISKANAADPKKSSFVRCARTDKGVHAAGNVVSLKLIVEDPDLVQKINEKLSPQIRVWGIQVTNKSFSCYQMCDSRIYEYLIPSHCFLPPHPSTYLGKKLVELAEQNGDMEGYKARQEEVAGFWEDVDEKHIKPILNGLPEDIRKIVQRALYMDEHEQEAASETKPEGEAAAVKTKPTAEEKAPSTTAEQEAPAAAEAESKPTTEQQQEDTTTTADPEKKRTESRRALINDAIKTIKAAYISAKKAYRIPDSRRNRLQEALNQYLGTRNFYNYTIQKTYRDPSAKRVIKSFNVNPTPIIINGTEWLSLKVHGQSFMMHQIRKMVAMAALVVRCGCPIDRIPESYGPTKIAIPKAPGLGLLLERPIFDSYNKKAPEYGKDKIDFGKYEKEIEEFKQREIYERIFREEEETNSFASFFNHIDHFQDDTFLYLTSGGLSAAKLPSAKDANRPAGADGEKGEQGQGEEPTKRRKTDKEALAEVESDSEPERGVVDNGEDGG
ncbi:hypothetical protein VTN00DRAFT_2604 [Thermoascus crustaceus]|uniref:uncharacterized protein n=1 Tax=Thermoascus crustaceus TaxID=5088 RepID=UPI0037430E66